MTAIETNGFDPGRRDFFRDQRTDFRSRVTVPTIGNAVTNRFVSRAGASQSPAAQIINDLARKVFERSLNTQPWLFGGSAQFVADVIATSQPLLSDLLVLIHGFLLRRCLTWFDLDRLALVADAFALVRLWFSKRPNFGGKLANLLFITALDDHMSLVRAGDT